MDLLKSPVVLYHSPTLAVLFKDMQSLNLRVMWNNLLRVVGITRSFIVDTMHVKKIWGILITLSIRSNHDLYTVIAYLSDCNKKIQ